MLPIETSYAIVTFSIQESARTTLRTARQHASKTDPVKSRAIMDSTDGQRFYPFHFHQISDPEIEYSSDYLGNIYLQHHMIPRPTIIEKAKKKLRKLKEILQQRRRALTTPIKIIRTQQTSK